MPRCLTTVAVFILSTIIILPSLAQADRRKYVWTYQYVMLPADAAELEFYQTSRLSEIDSWEYRIEIEHGLSHRMDVSIYQIFVQPEEGDFKWDAFQIRSRIRMADPGRLLLDPILYIEYRRKIDLKEQNKLEGKLILGRDFNRINLAVNPVYEFFWAPGDPIHEIGIDVGVSYEFSYRFCVGLESTSRYEYVPDGENEGSSYLGPTISLASGPIWYSLGCTWGLSDDSDDARVRFLMGVDL